MFLSFDYASKLGLNVWATGGGFSQGFQVFSGQKDGPSFGLWWILMSFTQTNAILGEQRRKPLMYWVARTLMSDGFQHRSGGGFRGILLLPNILGEVIQFDPIWIFLRWVEITRILTYQILMIQVKDLDPEDRQLFAVEKAGRGPMT